MTQKYEKSIQDKITIQHATPDSTKGISELFTKSYTKSYPYQELMDEENLRKILERGEQTTLIAAYKNQTIGCIGLVKNNNAHEIGRFIVDFPFRNLGIGKLLYRTLIAFITKHKKRFRNIFTECVTSNGRSIAVAQKNGLKVIGFGIGIYENYFEEGKPRETDCFLVYPTQPISLHKQTVYIHPNIEKMASAIYNHTLVKRSVVTEIIPPQQSTTIYDFQIEHDKQHACLTIHRVGKNLEQIVIWFLEKSQSIDALFLRVFLNTTNVHTAYAIDILLNHRFFFCSLWPSFFENNKFADVLSLQYISKKNTYSIENLDIPTPFSKQLFHMLNLPIV